LTEQPHKKFKKISAACKVHDEVRCLDTGIPDESCTQHTIALHCSTVLQTLARHRRPGLFTTVTESQTVVTNTTGSVKHAAHAIAVSCKHCLRAIHQSTDAVDVGNHFKALSTQTLSLIPRTNAAVCC